MRERKFTYETNAAGDWSVLRDGAPFAVYKAHNVTAEGIGELVAAFNQVANSDAPAGETSENACGWIKAHGNTTKPAEMLAKFPQIADVDNEDSPREDMICPQCGNRDAFSVLGTITTWGFLTTDGIDRDEGDFKYNAESPCRCGLCAHEAPMADFTCAGLDEYLNNLKAAITNTDL